MAAEPISDVDTTAGDMLEHLVQTLDEQGTTLVFAEMKGTALDRLRSFGLEHLTTPEHFQPSLNSALQAYHEAHPADVDSSARNEGS